MDIDDAASALLLQLLPMGVTTNGESDVLGLLSLSKEGLRKQALLTQIIYYIVAILSAKLLSFIF